MRIKVTPADVERGEIARCIETIYCDYSLSFSQGGNGARDTDGPVIWSASGVAGLGFNWVTKASIEGQEQEQIARVVGEYEKLKTSFWWIVGPSTKPVDLSEHLLAAGFTRLFSGPGMALDLSRIQAECDPPADVTIRRLIHSEALGVWDSSIAISQLSDENRTAIHAAFAGVPSSHAPIWHVAYRDGQSIARCLTFFGSDPEVVSMHDLFTIASARRQGIGTALAIQALNHAQSRGCKVGTLISSEAALGLYGKLGYEKYCEMEFFARAYPRG